MAVNLISDTQKKNFEQCLAEAKKLKRGNFDPELDNLKDDTVASVLFKVLSEWDLANEKFISVSKSKIVKVEQFLANWKEHIEDDYAKDKVMYEQFFGGNDKGRETV